MKTNYKFYPDAEHRFFVIDPQGDSEFYKTAEERDEAAAAMVAGYLDDGWAEGVDQIFVGEATGHIVARNVVRQPVREEFDTLEEFEEAMDEFGSADFSFNCSYEVAPLDDPGEKIPS